MLNYKVRDYVYIDTKNFYSKQPSKKPNFKSYNPYLVDKIISPYVY